MKQQKEDNGGYAQFRVSVPQNKTVMLFIAMGAAYIIKVYDINKPASVAWVEQNVKLTISQYVAPGSVNASLDFTISTLILWLCIYMSYRMVLRYLLRYKGWMFEGRGHVSLFTRVWAALLTIFSKGLSGFYAFQDHCPPLPVPRLDDTISRYLASMKELLTEAEFAKLKKNSSHFLATVGPAVQSALEKKWWISRNYVTDWWETYVYLKPRDSIMINSNYFGLSPRQTPTGRRESRAAGQIWSLLKWRKDALIDNKVLPLKLQKLVPLCPIQYKRFFATTRVPGKQTDEIITAENVTHIVVFAHCRAYQLEVINQNGRPFSPQCIESALDAIRQDDDESENKIGLLPAGTALERGKWARIREMVNAHNEHSLAIVESALFHVWLDDQKPSSDEATTRQRLCRRSLHGNGANIWFDKSYTMIFFDDGQFTLNCEHSWADGAVTCHVTEETNVIEHVCITYDADTGAIQPENGDRQPVEYLCLKWHNLEEDVMPLLRDEMDGVTKRIDDLDVGHLDFKKFGKDEIKKWKTSPDAICQMALQLANFKTRAKFSMTYEAGLARIFKDGRTETIRSCSAQSIKFVNEMMDEKSSKETRKKTLLAAVRHHGTLTKQAMIGDGVDRHLFALYVASVGLKIDSEFLTQYKNARWTESKLSGWELSTSCAPVGMGELFNPKKYPQLISMGAGFGWTNGFGVGYQMNDDSLIFHTSCSRGQDLSVEVFHQNLHESLLAMSEIFE